MNRNDNDSASEPNDPGQPGVDSRHENTGLEKDISRRESAVIDDEAAVLSREKSAAAREDAADLREDAADLREDAAHLREGAAQTREGEAHVREGSATSREQEIRVTGTIQAASDDHMLMLQHVNARLVIATIEAQKLA